MTIDKTTCAVVNFVNKKYRKSFSNTALKWRVKYCLQPVEPVLINQFQQNVRKGVVMSPNLLDELGCRFNIYRVDSFPEIHKQVLRQPGKSLQHQ